MKYSHFQETVETAGLEPRRCNAVHWQIRGGERLVNVWPNAKRGGFRFQEDGKKSRLGNLAQAIELAGPPPIPAAEVTAAPREETTKAPERVGLIRWLWRVLW